VEAAPVCPAPVNSRALTAGPKETAAATPFSAACAHLPKPVVEAARRACAVAAACAAHKPVSSKASNVGCKVTAVATKSTVAPALLAWCVARPALGDVVQPNVWPKPACSNSLSAAQLATAAATSSIAVSARLEKRVVVGGGRAAVGARAVCLAAVAHKASTVAWLETGVAAFRTAVYARLAKPVAVTANPTYAGV
jgi:hypothetical protein